MKKLVTFLKISLSLCPPPQSPVPELDQSYRGDRGQTHILVRATLAQEKLGRILASNRLRIISHVKG